MGLLAKERLSESKERSSRKEICQDWKRKGKYPKERTPQREAAEEEIN
jgi:hypothetical protein